MRESAVELNSRPSTSPGAPAAPPTPDKLDPTEVARWIDESSDRLVERWLADVRARGASWNPRVEKLLRRFFGLLVRMLPESLGPFSSQVKPLWQQTAQLFGSVAAQRGLAAGEVIEEFQLLREGLIRLLYDHPPSEGVTAVARRDYLRLNRTVDWGVSQASVGHTDVLFFSLFQGSGVPNRLDDELLAEVEDQLDEITAEFDGMMEALAG